MKTLYLPMLLVGSAAAAGLYFLFELVLNNSYVTLSTRFSQSFFNVFTIVPFLIICLGCTILVWFIFFRKFDGILRKQVILFSILVMIVGFSVFGFYLLD
ncbi:MAG: hypothetical protein ACREA1_05720 [Nitrosotalea sp.]